MTEPAFFTPSRNVTAADIAALTGATLVDPALAETQVHGIASADQGNPDALTFIEGKRNLELASRLRAAAVLCRPELVDAVPSGIAVLSTNAPQPAFAQMARLFFPAAVKPQAVTGMTGVSPNAFIAADAVIEEDVTIEPGAVVGARAEIGRGTIVAPHAVIGPDCRIGRDCYIGPGVSILCSLLGDRIIIHGGARLGQDGFGFVPGRHAPEKVPQIGRVIIQNDVEIGANTTIDRGTLGDTVVGEHTKIDNGVQIAHNVLVGRACLLAAHCGISGSVTIGDGVMMGGRVGVRDHVDIGAGAMFAGGTVVLTDVPAGMRWAGYPGRPHMEWLRAVGASRAAYSSSGKKRKRDG